MQLLDAVMSRVLFDITPAEPAILAQTLDVAFAREILLKLIERVRDMYCTTGTVEILQKCFVTGTVLTKEYREQIFSETSLVDTLLKGISSPNLHLPSYNQRTRSAVLKTYQQFTLQ